MGAAEVTVTAATRARRIERHGIIMATRGGLKREMRRKVMGNSDRSEGLPFSLLSPSHTNKQLDDRIVPTLHRFASHGSHHFRRPQEARAPTHSLSETVCSGQSREYGDEMQRAPARRLRMGWSRHTLLFTSGDLDVATSALLLSWKQPAESGWSYRLGEGRAWRPASSESVG